VRVRSPDEPEVWTVPRDAAQDDFIQARQAADWTIAAMAAGDSDQAAEVACALQPRQRIAMAMILAAQVADLRGGDQPP
jgi:hypothetical protein